jgi:hypothetical protein
MTQAITDLHRTIRLLLFDGTAARGIQQNAADNTPPVALVKAHEAFDIAS